MKLNWRMCLVVLVLVACGGWPGSSLPVAETDETWLSTWLGDRKIGYTISRCSRDGGGYRFENLMSMEIAMASRVQKVRSHSAVTVGPGFELRSFTFSFESQTRSFAAGGTVQGDELTIRIQGDKPRVLKLKGQVYPMSALGRLAVDRKLKPGTTHRFQVFDATVMAVVPVEIVVDGRESITVAGEEYDALKVRTRIAGFEVESWLDSQGMVLREKSPPGIRSERTTPKKAVARVAGGSLDLLKMFRVEVDSAVPRPAEVRRAKLAISGIDDEGVFVDGNQRILEHNPLVVEITMPELPDKPVKLPLQVQTEFLKPSLEIQCDDPALREKAFEAVGRPEDAVSGARELVSWVFTVMDKVPTASFPTALDVLKHMEGDCNEHAVFFAALARAVGIPAKVAVGLVYMDGAFYYHAWNEVFLGRWVPVDATFGEFPAGALRLKLHEGGLKEQARILSVVGKLDIRILEFE